MMENLIFKPNFLMSIFILSLAVTAPSAYAEDAAIHAHAYHADDVLRYRYDDTDTTYCGDTKDGLVITSRPLQAQQIQIAVKSNTVQVGSGLEHSVTVLGSSVYRRGSVESLTSVAFSPIGTLVKNLPSPLSYRYLSESFALAHLFDLFKGVFSGANFMSDPVSQFLFFKMQDVHQMQASALGLRDGLLPGQSYVVPGKATSGLGGSFSSGDTLYEYVGVQQMDGHRVALVRVNDLGNQFSTKAMHVYTNFTYQMLVGLDGPQRGLLVSGSGQETAYPVTPQSSGKCHQPVLQRQFSMTLQP